MKRELRPRSLFSGEETWTSPRLSRKKRKPNFEKIDFIV